MKEFHLSSTQIHIINQLLDAHEPLSSQFLANGLGVSSKTIRKCIEEAQDLLKINGANIEIKPGSGYRLIIEDDEAFDEFKHVEQLGKQNRNVFSINLDRAHLVVRYLLTHNGKISIEDLCDLLYINRTSAKKVLGKAREILARFNLAAVFQSKKGIVVVGEEKDIRLCLVYEYSYFMTSYHFHGQDEYKDIIGLNDPYFNEVENLIISFQNNFEEYNLSSYSVMYIARLIIVSKNRITMSHPLILDDEITKHYCNRNTYFVAKMILKECEKLYNIPFSSYDNILVAMCLVALRVTIKEPEVYRFGYFEHKDLALDIAQELTRVNMFSSNKQDIKLIEDLSYNIEGLLTRYKYHILTSQFRLVGYPQLPQMARKMSLQVASYLKKTRNIDLIPDDIFRLAIVIYPLFGRYPFVFSKINACVISGIDKTEGKGLKERLLRNFGTYIKEIDLLEIGYLLWQHIKQIILCFLCGTVIAVLFTVFMISPKYKSTARMFVVSGNNSIVDLSSLQIGKNLTGDYTELIKSRTVLEEVINELNLDLNYVKLSKEISVTNPTDTRILNITVTDNSPQLAADIANTLAEKAKEYIPSVMNTEKPNIFEKGIVPTQKSSPSTSKNGILGGLLFSFAYMGFLIVKHLMNDTFMNPEDIQKAFGIQPLAAIPSTKKKRGKK